MTVRHYIYGLSILLIVAFAAPGARAQAAAVDPDSMESMLAEEMTSSAVDAKPKPLTKAESEFFESKVRPILVSNCYRCHSAEEKKSKGGLTLDTREGWQHGGHAGPAIVPGAPEKSVLVTAISYSDPDLQMPPDEQLSDDKVAVLRQWVKMGAPDPRESVAKKSSLTGLTDTARAHWSYQPVKEAPVPPVQNEKWVKTPIDAFILAKLEGNGMRPSGPSPREALIRRATYDLIGLPPTPEEVDAFVRDRSADSFEKVVDRLLASPHFGERWGRYWLDTARYSDTTGADNRRGEYRFPFAWTYRDYVIESFNADKPYNVFLKEQLAADLMPESKKDPSILAGLGFITVGKRFQNQHDTIDERIDAVTKGMMGLTVSCARCHDHKFDPIPTADYYALHGVFNSTEEPAEKPLIVKVQGDDTEYRDFQSELAKLEAKNREAYFDLIEKASTEFRKKTRAYLMVAALTRKGAVSEVKERNELIKSHKLDRNIYQGAFRTMRRDNAVAAPLIAFATLSSEKFATAAPRMLREVQSGGSRRLKINPLVVEAFNKVPDGSIRTIEDVVDVYAKLIDSIRPTAGAYLDACRNAGSDKIEGFDPDLVELINTPIAVEQAAVLTTAYLTEIASQLPVVNQRGYDRLVLDEINQLFLTHPGSPPRAMVVEDVKRPQDSPIFIRGEVQNRGKIVPRQFLEILAGPDRESFKQGSGRLELAEAIASDTNPLTARVAVNRIWMHLFGQAFVRTPDDLGVQCEAPSHPELLDYLALQFVKEGWSVKETIRTIMLSSVYQQNTDTNRAFTEKDPENRLLWRCNVRRLDFEAIRDTMLAFTGKLDPTIGGKPVNLSDEPYSNRRSVYGYIDRGNLPELMAQFDFADPDMVNSKRTATIVPQQALFFMNSPMAADVARKVTTRPEFLEAKDDAGRVKALYEVLFQREPRAVEIRFAKEFFFSATPAEIREITGTPAPKPRSPQEARAQERAKRIEDARIAREEKIRENMLKRQQRGGNRSAIINNGDIVARTPLNLWEQYAQALLFTNEIAYLN